MSDEQKRQQDQSATAMPERQPIFNLPPVVAAIAGLFVAIQVIDSFVLNESTRQELLVWLAFIPYRIVDIAAAPGGFWPLLWTPFTHAFLHSGWEHVLLNTVWFVIFATPVAGRPTMRDREIVDSGRHPAADAEDPAGVIAADGQ